MKTEDFWAKRNAAVFWVWKPQTFQRMGKDVTCSKQAHTQAHAEPHLFQLFVYNTP